MSILKLDPPRTSAFKSTKLISINTQQLQSKVNFDTLAENRKPESVNSGFKHKQCDSVSESANIGKLNTPMLAELPNLHKQTGSSMSTEGFILIPRTLLIDPNWKGMRLKYQRLYLLLIENASYRERDFSYNGNPIKIKKGQVCISLRRLVDLYNEGVKYKEERVDLPLVQRAVSVFTKFGLSIHESIHGITLFTLTQSDVYEHFNRQTDTPSDTESIRNRYTNEKRKEREDVKETIDRADAPDRSSLSNLKKEEQQRPSAFEAPKPRPSKNPMTQEQQKHYETIWPWLVKMNMAEGYTVQNSNGKTPKGIKSSDLEVWLKTYPFDTIAQVIKQVQKETVDLTYPGYIVRLFKANVVAKKSNLEVNDAYVKSVIAQTKCTHLEDLKQYVRDLSNDNDFQKTLPPEVFKGMIDNSLRQAKERETEERYNRDEDDYY